MSAVSKASSTLSNPKDWISTALYKNYLYVLDVLNISEKKNVYIITNTVTFRDLLTLQQLNKV